MASVESDALMLAVEAVLSVGVGVDAVLSVDCGGERVFKVRESVQMVVVDGVGYRDASKRL